jgi:acetylornithine deacetylase
MLQALCELAQCRQRPATTEIVFAGLVDEENAQAGSRALAASKFAAHLAIVGEATRSKVVTSHKGSLWIDLQTHGKSAHGARPELGKNAIHEMAKAVNIIQTEYAAGLKKRRHPHLGSATVSVGTIKGGVQPNIVPDSCSISLDRRTLPGETETGVFRELKSLLKRRGIGCSFSGTKLAPCLPLETDPKLPLVSQFMRAAGQRKPVGVDYFCDASVLSHGGIPSVVFGPGDIAQAHTTDEWIDLRSLENGKDLLFRFLSSLP